MNINLKINKQLFKNELLVKISFYIQIVVALFLLFIYTNYNPAFMQLIKYKNIHMLYISVTILAYCYFKFFLKVLKRQIYFKKNILLIFFLFYCGLTILFSEIKGDASKNYIYLLAITSYFGLLASELKLKQLIDLFFIFFNINIVLNIFISIVLPNITIADDMRYNNSLQGIFGHRNIFAIYIIFAIFFNLIKSKDFNKKYIIYIWNIICIYYLYRTRSVTGIIVVLFCFIMYKFFLKRKSFNLFAYAYLFYIFVNFMLFNGLTDNSFISSALGKLLGRGGNLTGRTDIWSFCTKYIMINPIWGYGFSSFFPTHQQAIPNTWLNSVAHAHNLILEQLLELGVVGLIIFLLLLLDILWKFYNLKNREGTIFILMLLSMLIFNISEPLFYNVLGIVIPWVVFITIYININYMKKKKIDK
jgi:O-antigen ligase